MPTKVQELRQDHRGDRTQYVICNPRIGKIRKDQIWNFIQKHPNEQPWK